MPPSNSVFRLSILLLLIVSSSLVVALFEDQVGSSDRIVLHTGPIRTAVSAGGKNLLVSTDAGVVSAISQRTGEPAWRVVLPDSEVLLSAASSRTLITTLSSVHETSHRCVVRAYSVEENGGIVWEESFSCDSSSSSSSTTSITISTAAKSVAVVQGGNLRVYNSVAGVLLQESLSSSSSSSSSTLFATYGGGNTDTGILVSATTTSSSSKDGLIDAITLHVAQPRGAAREEVVELGASVNARNIIVIPTMTPSSSSFVLFAAGNSVHCACCGNSGGKSSVIVKHKNSGSDAVIVSLTLVPDTGFPATTSSSSSTTSSSIISTFVRADLSDGTVAFVRVVSGGETPTTCEKALDIAHVGQGHDSSSSEKNSNKNEATSWIVTAGSITTSSSSSAEGASSSSSSSSYLMIAESHLVEGVRFILINGATGEKSASTSSVAESDVAASIDDATSGSSSSSSLLPLPISASALEFASRGLIARIFPIRFARAVDPTKPGWRAVVVLEDGSSAMVQGGKVIWLKSEGDACSAQVLTVDVSRISSSSSSSTAAAAIGASLAFDPELTLKARIQGQLGYLYQKFKSFQMSTLVNILHVIEDPTGVLLHSFGIASGSGDSSTKDGKQQLQKGGKGSGGGGGKNKLVSGGSMIPNVLASTTKMLIMRTRVDGNGDVETCGGGYGYGTSASSSSSGVVGSLYGQLAETGVAAWRIALPYASEAKKAAASSPVSGSSSAAVVVRSTVLVSRAAPIQMHPAELLLVETVSSIASTASTASTATSTITVYLTWINAESGIALSSASYVATSGVAHISRTPVVHAALQREVYAIVHHDGTAVIAPAPEDVVSSLKSLGSDFVIASLTFETQSLTEGASGHTLLFSNTAAATNGDDEQLVSSIRVSPKKQTSTTHSVMIKAVRTTTVWQSQLAGPIIDGGVNRVLAVAFGGGVAASSPMSSHDTKGASKELLEEAVAAAIAETEGRSENSASILATKGVQVLPDDKLLLKSMNPHLFVVAVGPPGPSSTPFERTHAIEMKEALAISGKQSSSSLSLLLPSYVPTTAVNGNLTVYVFDAITGRLLHTRKHSGCSGPVSIVVQDNWIANTYWNARVRRPEVCTASMYEGAIDTYELAPWKRKSIEAINPSISSYTALPPFVRHRTYILPLSVRSLAITHTRFGITTPHFLFGTEAGGVLMMDRRLLDPRRPTAEPTDAEKAEGLAQYNPHLPMRHSWVVNHGNAAHRLHTLVAVPAAFESTTYIVAVGIDTFVSRIAPANAFDQLDPDFNFALFVLILVGGLVGVVYLGREVAKKDVRDAWK